MSKNKTSIQSLLDEKISQYNVPEFIEKDPIKFPHAYTKKQDVEIAAFIAAILALGKTSIIIEKAKFFLELMDNSPYDFVENYCENDLKPFENFKHRTFNGIDAIYLLRFLQYFYRKHDSLEFAFVQGMEIESFEVKVSLENFFDYFFSLPDHPTRTYKHIPTPKKKSACKRLNLFLRWMVRNDHKLDLGIWKKIPQSKLICPCDTHVFRMAREHKLLKRKSEDWKAAEELTRVLRTFDSEDPIKYEFALFNMGKEKRYEKE